VHVVYALDSLIGGGAQRQVVELGRALVRHHDCRVSVMVYREFDFFARAADEGGIDLVPVIKRRRWDVSLPHRMGAWLRRARPTLVHAFMLAPSAWSFAALRTLPRSERPPLVAAVRNAFRHEPAGARLLRRALYARCDAVTANSHEAAHDLRTLLGLSAERVRLLPNGIDVATWDVRAREPCPLPLDSGRFELGVIGRFSRQKDQELLLEAVARVPPEERAKWRVWLIGSQDTEPEATARIFAAIERLGLDHIAEAPGAVTALPAVMARLDAVVMTSRWEGFPNVILEAMAAGRPTVATPVGEVPYMIESGRSGFILPDRSPSALAAALRSLQDLSTLERSRMGAAARSDCTTRYAMPRVVDAHLEFYREVAQQQGTV